MKYYCIGIKGTGMSTLAQILYDLGNEVSGYDDVSEYKFTQKGLDERGIRIYTDNNHDIDKDTIVTYSVAFKEDHKELKRVKEMGLTIKKYNEIVGEVVEKFLSIGVSGTHGKTTTSSIIRYILENTLGCNYFIGAGDGYVSSKNKYFVIESDEFNRHFLAYHPKYAIITNIEKEHLECYKDIDDIRNTFEKFASNTSDLIVACGDNKEVKKIKYKTKVLFYGVNNDNDIVIKNEKLSSDGSSFDIYINNELYDSYFVPLYGHHSVLNATAAITMCVNIGVDKERIKEALKTFKNAERRFAVEKVKDTVIIDDYAHHPTEIEATLNAAHQKFPNKKIVAVFKPNTYSRTKDFTDDFANALRIADKVFITPIDSNREKQEEYPGVKSEMIIEKIDDAELITEKDISKLKNYKDTVICFMSCASISHLIDSFKNIL